MGIVILESPRTSKLAFPGLLGYIGHVVCIFETYAPFSSSIEANLHSLRRKYQALTANPG
jgi:hypothetical protein